MQELVKEYREWRKAEGLPWNANFLPRSFDGLPDLEHKYWLAEQKAIEFERDRDWKKAVAVEPKALPPARPRVMRSLVRKGTTPGEILVRKQGKFGGEELEALLGYIDNGLNSLATEFGKVRANDIAEIQKALDQRLKWRGTWRTGESYAVNGLVQDKGTVFVAVAAKAEGRPGADSGWRMLVKTQERAAK